MDVIRTKGELNKFSSRTKRGLSIHCCFKNTTKTQTYFSSLNSSFVICHRVQFYTYRTKS